MPTLHYRPKHLAERLLPPACLIEASPERICTDLTVRGFYNLRKASLHPQYCRAAKANQPLRTLLSRYANNATVKELLYQSHFTDVSLR